MIKLTEKNKARKISLFKRMVVSVWMLWEKAFHVAFRLKPVGGVTSYHYRIRKYSGPATEMKGGKWLRSGDQVLEFHFDNQKLFELGMSARSSVQIAIRMIRDMEKGLPDVARVLENDPKGGEVVALYGVSLIHKGSEQLGFQTFDLPKGPFSWMTRSYLKFMLSIIHPDGGRRVKEFGGNLTPKMILMERSELLSWKDRSSRQRHDRSTRQEPQTLAVPMNSGVSADHIGV